VSLNIFLKWFLSIFSPIYMVANGWNAEDYTKANRLQNSWADPFFFSRYNFRGDESVLDIGCGDGSLTNRIALKTSGQVLGIDNSHNMIEHAKSLYQNEQVKFELCSAENDTIYQKITASYDLVVSFHCLHWVQDHNSVLKGVMTALRQGGVAFLRFASDGFDPIQELADELCTSDKWQDLFSGFLDPIHRFGIEQYRKLLQAHGFVIVELKEFIGTDILEDLTQLRNHVKGWLPHSKFLGEKIGSRFLDELINEYVSRYPIKANGKIELPDSYLEIIVTKGN